MKKHTLETSFPKLTLIFSSIGALVVLPVVVAMVMGSDMTKEMFSDFSYLSFVVGLAIGVVRVALRARLEYQKAWQKELEEILQDKF